MPGGLINIATYGSQDIFLTGTPEISFFKVIYRRNTNFSMESIRLKFDDTVNFDKYTTLTFPKTGDLINKSYLEIVLPEIYFTRKIDTEKKSELYSLYNQYLDNYDIINNYMIYNIEAYNNAINYYNLENTTVEDMIHQIDITPLDIPTDDFKNILLNLTLEIDSPISDDYILTHFYYNCISMYDIAHEKDIFYSSFTTEYTKDELKESLDFCYKLNKLLVEYYQWLIDKTYKEYLDASNTNYKFAWVKRLGHSIIEYVNLYIGGDLIDKHYGEWIDIWYELTCNKNYEEPYLKIIGNTPELTNFDRTNKPKTVLYVPLVFWFNRFNGQALPLISLQYHDIQLGLKLRKFSQVAYIENINNTRINLDNLYEEYGYQINVNLLQDYIYLDTLERRKFAQSAHEYLIDIVQHQIEDNEIDEYKTKLEFTNPSKELIWIVQRKSLQKNYNGYNECMWTNFGTELDGSGNPCITCLLTLNGTKMFDLQSSIWFNKVIPNNCHTKIPKDGINCYSFCLMPEEHQPSGSCNLSRITIAQLDLYLNEKILYELDRNTGEKTDLPETVSIRVFSLSQNILRIIGGMGVLAFSA